MKLAFFACFLILKVVFGSYDFSNSKCREYSGRCKQRRLEMIPLIIGGSDAKVQEFPHMALIGFGKEPDIKWECGGALISETYVLSAAHCGDSRELGTASKIRFGLIHRNEVGNHIQERNIQKVIPYPEYKRPIKYHDIALFQLDQPVVFTDFVRPACLNTLQSFRNQVPSAIGFGKTKFTDEHGNDKLEKVDLPILSNSVCQPFYASMRVSTLNKGGLIDSQICAGTLEGGKDTCQGDSGGPLQIFLPPPYCNFNIVGVTSFGKFCGYAKSPAIYTKVFNYVPWIVKIVWGN